jgi:hypothetical protein
MFEMVEQEAGNIFELTEKSKEPWMLVVSCLVLIHGSLLVIEELLNMEEKKRGVSHNNPIQEA